MTVDTDIANEALSECVARATITSLQEKSKEARIVSVLYNNTRDSMLRAAPWNFARAMVQLSLLKALPGTPENPTTPSPLGWQPSYPALPWAYSYAQPGDCVRMRFITGQQQTNESGVPVFSVPSGLSSRSWMHLRTRPFTLGTDVDNENNPATVVLTNQSRAIGVYTRRITNPDLWDEQFHQAMVKALASRLVLPLSGEKTLKKTLMDEANSLIMAARISDANEGTSHIEEHIPDWIRAHGYSGHLAPGGHFMEYDTPFFLGV